MRDYASSKTLDVFKKSELLSERYRLVECIAHGGMGSVEGELLVMQYVAGGSRYDVFRGNGGPGLLLARAPAIVLDACAGLHAIHTACSTTTGAFLGLTHRDVARALATDPKRRFASVADFGRQLEEAAAGAIASRSRVAELVSNADTVEMSFDCPDETIDIDVAELVEALPSEDHVAAPAAVEPAPRGRTHVRLEDVVVESSPPVLRPGRVTRVAPLAPARFARIAVGVFLFLFLFATTMIAYAGLADDGPRAPRAETSAGGDLPEHGGTWRQP